MKKVKIRWVDFQEVINSISNKPPDNVCFILPLKRNRGFALGIFVHDKQFINNAKKCFRSSYEDYNNGAAYFLISFNENKDLNKKREEKFVKDLIMGMSL